MCQPTKKTCNHLSHFILCRERVLPQINPRTFFFKSTVHGGYKEKAPLWRPGASVALGSSSAAASCDLLSESASPTTTTGVGRSHPLPPPPPIPAAPLLPPPGLKADAGFLYAVAAEVTAKSPPLPLLLMRRACLAVALADIHLSEMSVGPSGLALLAAICWRQAMAVTQLSSANLATGMSSSCWSTSAPSWCGCGCGC